MPSLQLAIATVGTTGDVVPFATLARGLRAAGHEVRAVSWELHRGAFEAAGAAFSPAGPATTWDEIADTARRAAAARSPLDQVASLRDFHLRDAERHYTALREVLPGHDLVLLNGYHSLAVAAARDLGLRWATAVFDPVLLPTATRPPAGLPSLGPLNRIGWWMLDRMLGRLNGPLDDALRAAGSASADDIPLFRGRSPLLHLVACSPTIAGVPGDLAPHVQFTGAWTDPAPPAPLPAPVEAFLAAGPPPVVISFGSMAFSDPARLGAIVVEALRRAGLRGIVQAGAAGLRPAAADDLLPVDALDHRSLFPRVAAVVHHGGAGTSHAVAAAGVPSIVVPHVGDQAFWADRLHRLGVSPSPVRPRSLSAESLADRLREATTSGQMRASATGLAERLASEDGLANAIGLLEAAAG
ncbi:MAG TPA: glycosyltransferase [Candidatus Limnocylindria bacterium]|jgi:UDP:flavonoid glycosyltransferase YjiC (YdhE family)